MPEVLITGGAGFIGATLAHRMLAHGRRVTVLDNLAGAGSDENLADLQDRYGPRLRVILADIRNRRAVREALGGAGTVCHLAAQSSPARSREHLADNFEINSDATAGLVEEAQLQRRPLTFIFASSYHVYGALDSVQVSKRGLRYEPSEQEVRLHGIREDWPLSLNTPLGCSKRVAEIHVLNSGLRSDVRNIVLRFGPVYGPRGYDFEEDASVSGWLTRALRGSAITLHGDGHRVCDFLYVDDAVSALVSAEEKAAELSGGTYNVGGGVCHSASQFELAERLVQFGGRPGGIDAVSLSAAPNFYASDTRRFAQVTGWSAGTSLTTGLKHLRQWLMDSGLAPTPRWRHRSLSPQEVAV